MRVKVFRLGLNGAMLNDRSVWPLLGLTASHQQAQVLVAAPSKPAALGLANSIPGLSVPYLSDPEFRLAMGNDVDELVAAGQFTEPRVLAANYLTRGLVVELRADGHRVIGEFVSGEGYAIRFVPAPGADA